MPSDTASTTSRLTIPISPTFSTDASSSAPQSALTSDEEPDLGAFATVFWALNNIQPLPPRMPMPHFASSSPSSSQASHTPINDQSSISSFTAPGLSNASGTDSPGLEAAPTSVWAQYQLQSYFNIDSITPSSERVQELEDDEYNIDTEHATVAHLRYSGSPPLPSPLSDGSRTVEIYEVASDLDIQDTVSLPESDHSPSRGAKVVPVTVGGMEAYHLAASVPSRDSASSDSFQVPTPRRSSFPIQDGSTAYSHSSYSHSTSRPLPALSTHHHQRSWAPTGPVDDLSTVYSHPPDDDPEAAVQSLLIKARASRSPHIVNDNSTVSQSSVASDGSHSPQTPSYSPVSSTSFSSPPRAPQAYHHHRRDSQGSNRSINSNRFSSPRVKPSSPLRTSFTQDELAALTSPPEFSPGQRSVVVDISTDEEPPRGGSVRHSPRGSAHSSPRSTREPALAPPPYASPPAPAPKSFASEAGSEKSPPSSAHRSPRSNPISPPKVSPEVKTTHLPYTSPSRRPITIDAEGLGRAYRAFSPRVTSPLRTSTLSQDAEDYMHHESPTQRSLVIDGITDEDGFTDESHTPTRTFITHNYMGRYELQLPSTVVLAQPMPVPVMRAINGRPIPWPLPEWAHDPSVGDGGGFTPDAEKASAASREKGTASWGSYAQVEQQRDVTTKGYDEVPSLGLLDEALSFIANERAKREAIRSHHYGEHASSKYATSGITSVF